MMNLTVGICAASGADALGSAERAERQSEALIALVKARRAGRLADWLECREHAAKTDAECLRIRARRERAEEIAHEAWCLIDELEG